MILGAVLGTILSLASGWILAEPRLRTSDEFALTVMLALFAIGWVVGESFQSSLANL